MPKLKTLIRQVRPPKVATVGDVVSRESLTAGIRVGLRLVDQMTLRKAIDHFEIKAERTYRVRNPAGVITQEAWDIIKEALKQREAVIFVDGEEDLLAIPTIIESPENSFIVYGQPSQGLVVVTATTGAKAEVRQMVDRMTRE
jgi:GTP-dependent dephospho-CoA kinase